MPKLPKLKIIIEGPVGSGRTTVAAITSRFLRKCGYTTTVIDDGAEVPPDFGEALIENIENCLQPQALEIVTTATPVVRKTAGVKRKVVKDTPLFVSSTTDEGYDSEDVRF